MHFHANYVSTSVFGDGDYYQVTFQAEQDTDDPDSPYLLIQRQFEDPDDNWCYIAIRSHSADAVSHPITRSRRATARWRAGCGGSSADLAIAC